jgi:glucose-1-phosphate thymidylyltransferase
MKCIILAAGYATRLYPLTKNKPKPLLDVAGKPILEHILEKVSKVTDINEVFIVTNDRFYSCFIEWEKGYRFPDKIRIVNDGTTTNENRCIIKTKCAPGLFSFIKHIPFKWYFIYVFYIGY